MDFGEALKYQRAEDINVSYEEALKLAPPPIKRKDTAQRGADTQGREDSIEV